MFLLTTLFVLIAAFYNNLNVKSVSFINKHLKKQAVYELPSPQASFYKVALPKAVTSVGREIKSIPSDVIKNGADKIVANQYNSNLTFYSYIYNAGYVKRVVKNHELGSRLVFAYLETNDFQNEGSNFIRDYEVQTHGQIFQPLIEEYLPVVADLNKVIPESKVLFSVDGVILNKGFTSYPGSEAGSKPTFALELNTSEGVKSYYGIGLKIAIEEAQAQIGDTVTVSKIARVPVKTATGKTSKVNQWTCLVSK